MSLKFLIYIYSTYNFVYSLSSANWSRLNAARSKLKRALCTVCVELF